MDEYRAADLPEGSVVATDTQAWIKVSRPRSAVARTRWYGTRGTHADDTYVDRALRSDGAQVLRVGTREEG